MLQELLLLEQRLSAVKYCSSANRMTTDSNDSEYGNCFAVANEIMRRLLPYENSVFTVEGIREDLLHFEAGLFMFMSDTSSIHTLGMDHRGISRSPQRYLDDGVCENLQSERPQPVLGHIDIETDNIKSEKADIDIRDMIIVPQMVVRGFLKLALPKLEIDPVWDSVLDAYYEMTDNNSAPVMIDTTL